MSSGFSVRNKILPGKRTVVGRFSIFLCSKASITESASPSQSYFTPDGRYQPSGKAFTAEYAEIAEKHI
jgi:hypothetical protein